MKKRILILIALLTVAVLVLGGCMKFDYTQLNEMFSQNYSSVNVTVATTMNGETLTSTFDVTNSGSSATVNYSVQSFRSSTVKFPTVTSPRKAVRLRGRFQTEYLWQQAPICLSQAST